MSAALTESAKTQSPASYLYTRIATSHLGETSAIVISTLISYGRLTAKEIGIRSKLPLKLVKTTLVSLIQLNCIHYWSDPAKLVFYSFSETGILILLHAGEIVNHIKVLYGDEAAEIVQNIIENGNMTVKDYLSTVVDEETRIDRMALLIKLYNDGWLHRLCVYNYHPVEDVWNRLYQETLKNTPRNATTSEVKRVAEAKEKTKVKFDDLFNSGNDPKDIFYVEAGIYKLRSHITFGFSLKRFEKHLRTRALVDLANSRLGMLTSKVYEACCLMIEQKSPDLHHRYMDVSGLINDPEEERMFLSSVENSLVDNKMTVLNVRDLGSHLPKSMDLRNSILTQNFLKPGKRISINGDGPSTKKVKLEDGTASVQENGDFDVSEADNAETCPLSLIVEHMRLLTSANVPFLFEVSPGSYTIPFLQLSKYIKQYHYDVLIKTTMGPNALRVLKCIKDMKLVDEKAISNSVLLKERTVKNALYRLINMNIVEIQEVPRSADRAALKTFYLFRHKGIALYRYLSNALIFSMGELLTNVAQIKQDNNILLEKCEREDVKGHEEELLLESELKTLRDLQVREIRNIGHFNRIKWLYVVFGVL